MSRSPICIRRSRLGRHLADRLRDDLPIWTPVLLIRRRRRILLPTPSAPRSIEDSPSSPRRPATCLTHPDVVNPALLDS
jgi:hypothetical protein